MGKRGKKLKSKNKELSKEVKRLKELVDSMYFIHKGILKEIRK